MTEFRTQSFLKYHFIHYLQLIIQYKNVTS